MFTKIFHIILLLTKVDQQTHTAFEETSFRVKKVDFVLYIKMNAFTMAFPVRKLQGSLTQCPPK